MIYFLSHQIVFSDYGIYVFDGYPPETLTRSTSLQFELLLFSSLVSFKPSLFILFLNLF